ncbi:MAG: DUF4242 domain-containing protein [Rhizobiaceae bacterium]
MKKFVIERELPGVGAMSKTELGGAAETSNKALAQLAPNVQWQHSYVAGDKTFCIYLAQSGEDIQKHAELSGFPANKVTEIITMIDPTS